MATQQERQDALRRVSELLAAYALEAGAEAVVVKVYAHNLTIVCGTTDGDARAAVQAMVIEDVDALEQVAQRHNGTTVLNELAMPNGDGTMSVLDRSGAKQ